MQILIFLLAILPGLAICAYIFYVDKHEREVWWHLLVCFILGMVSTFPALYFETLVTDAGYDATGNLFQVFLYSLLGVAFIEEVAKSCCLFIFPYFNKWFNEPMDGIVYSVMIGMGFATVENIFYAYSNGLETVLVRAFTAVPAHAVFAIISGYYVGLAKFNKEKRIQLILTGLGLAILVHGVYNFFLLQELYEWLSIFAIVTLFISYQFAKRMIELHQKSSPFYAPVSVPEPPTLKDAFITETINNEIQGTLNSPDKEEI
jgi:RsiW-degrading membrane proteinase PrsW (M82 family)